MTTSDQINLAIAISAALSTAAAFVVAWLTLSAVKANQATAEVMRAQLEASTRPYVTVTPQVRLMSTLFELRVFNAGSSGAKNLRLSLDKDYFLNAEQDESKNLRRYTAFCLPITEFAPRAELVFVLGVGPTILHSDLTPVRFKVTAAYEWAGHKVEEVTEVDLQPYRNSTMPTEPVAERLDLLTAEIKNFSKAIHNSRGGSQHSKSLE